jgi:Domain of unknown function (DUF5082)
VSNSKTSLNNSISQCKSKISSINDRIARLCSASTDMSGVYNSIFKYYGNVKDHLDSINPMMGSQIWEGQQVALVKSSYSDAVDSLIQFMAEHSSRSSEIQYEIQRQNGLLETCYSNLSSLKYQLSNLKDD